MWPKYARARCIFHQPGKFVWVTRRRRGPAHEETTISRELSHARYSMLDTYSGAHMCVQPVFMNTLFCLNVHIGAYSHWVLSLI